MKILLTVALVCVMFVQAQADNRGRETTKPNIHGGQNFYHNGRYVGQSRPNVFGGSNYYDTRRYVTGSRPNVYGGYNYGYGSGYNSVYEKYSSFRTK